MNSCDFWQPKNNSAVFISMEKNLNSTPITRALVQNYISVCYEEESHLSTEETLYNEYQRLEQEGKLYLLYEAELLSNGK